jgi:hypothetical protein
MIAEAATRIRAGEPRPAFVPHVREDVLHAREEVVGPLEERHPFGGQRHAARGPVKEPHAELFFKVVHRPRDCGPRKAERVGGAGKAAGLGDPHEDGKRTKHIHRRLFLFLK